LPSTALSGGRNTNVTLLPGSGDEGAVRKEGKEKRAMKWERSLKTNKGNLNREGEHNLGGGPEGGIKETFHKPKKNHGEKGLGDIIMSEGNARAST